jgi:hypothetical protein
MCVGEKHHPQPPYKGTLRLQVMEGPRSWLVKQSTYSGFIENHRGHTTPMTPRRLAPDYNIYSIRSDLSLSSRYLLEALRRRLTSCCASQVLILWAGPPLAVRPMSIAVGTWNYTPQRRSPIKYTLSLRD